jgi:hypothetical protein
VIAICQKGDTVVPTMICVVCRKALSIQQAWMAFPALGNGVTQAEGRFVHRQCIDGHGQETMQSGRFVLWRGASLLERLLRG